MIQQAKQGVILRVTNLKKYFPIQTGLFKKATDFVRAVDGVSFQLAEGETLGLVGESGCGKTTIAHCIMQLQEPTAGDIELKINGEFANLTDLSKKEMKAVYPHMQMIFQDPFSALNPRMTIRDIVTEPLRIQKVGTPKERAERTEYLLNRVGLNTELMNRYPHEFSGGQRQRIGIARALALQPSLVICDEPVSALDVSVQAQVLNLLDELQDEFNLTFLFISHDLSVIEHISDRVAVMYLGKIVEIGPANEMFSNPRHPYTEALLAAIPSSSRQKGARKLLEGTVPSPSSPPSGCHFHTRCAYATDICQNERPKEKRTGDFGHYVRCHHFEKLNLKGYGG